MASPSLTVACFYSSLDEERKKIIERGIRSCLGYALPAKLLKDACVSFFQGKWTVEVKIETKKIKMEF